MASKMKPKMPPPMAIGPKGPKGPTGPNPMKGMRPGMGSVPAGGGAAPPMPFKKGGMAKCPPGYKKGGMTGKKGC